MSHRNVRQISFALLIAVFTIFFYSKSFHFQYHQIDDHEYVWANGDIRRLNIDSAVKWFTKDYVLMYVPLVMGSFALDYHFWKLNAFGYHLTNVVLHALNAILVWMILLVLTKDQWVSLVVTFLFIVHPVQIETVAWISERKNLLSSFFFLLCFYAYRTSRFWFCVSVFVCAVLSKPNTVVLPALLILSDWFYGTTFTKAKRVMLFSFMAACSIILFLYMLHINHSTEINLRGGNYLVNTYIMLTVFFRYILLLLYPYHQQLYYLTEVYQTWTHLPVMMSIGGMITFWLVLIRLTIKRNSIGFWMLWFLVALLPTSNFIIPMTSLMHDRYLYLPIVGFFCAAFMGFAQLATRFQVSRFLRVVAVAVILLLATSQSLLATQRLNLWGRGSDLWASDIRKSKYPDSRLLIGFATELAREKKFSEASLQMQGVIVTFNDFEASMRQVVNWMLLNQNELVKEALDKIDLNNAVTSAYWLGFYYDMYGQYWLKQENVEKAEWFFKESLKYYQKDVAYASLSDIYFVAGKVDLAIETILKALKLDPDSQVAMSKLCSYYLHQKDYENAYRVYRELERLYPNDPMALHILKQMALEERKS